MTPIREHAKTLIIESADEGLKNLRAQLAAAMKANDVQKSRYYERRITERKRFLERIQK